MEEYQDFEEFISLLNKHKVEYLIVGGYAVTFHSRPRFTEDIDVWVNRTKKNSKRVFKALEEFGFGNIDIKPEDFTKEGLILQLGYRPVRIDILTSIEGVKFSEAYKSKRTDLFYGRVNANYINLELLFKNKKTVNRKKDKEAIEWINDNLKKKK